MAFFLKGVHVPHRKYTADKPALRIEAPDTVKIPMSMHIGAPAKPVVKVGDIVKIGTLIGESSGFVSSDIYSSISGKVKKIEDFTLSSGAKTQAVVIESDGEMARDESLAAPSVGSAEELTEAIRKSGVVGLGGAGFPTHVKFKVDPARIEELIVNGAECEPYITSDTRTMLDRASDIREGVELILKHSKIGKVYIGIEKNKPECIAKLREVFADMPEVEVAPMPDTYPQGAEKILIYNTTGRVVPEGGLPSDAGVLVMNVTTVATLAEYVRTGMPLVKKCITVDGSIVKEPKNLIVPIGTSVAEVLEAAGGLTDEPGKVLFGGPMMGVAIYSLEYPVMKNCNAIVVLNKKDAKKQYENPCIHCGRCVAICPMGLNPTVYAKALNVTDAEDRIERYTQAKLNLCIECGSCSFVCPSNRPLVENNRIAKSEMREFMLARQAQKK